MSCWISLKSGHEFEFSSCENKTKILIEILLTYSNLTVEKIANQLSMSTESLIKIVEDPNTPQGKIADDVAQLFLIFFGNNFYKQFTFVRKFN